MTARQRTALWIGVSLLLLAIVGAQLWSAEATRSAVLSAIQTPVGNRAADVDLEKARQEVISARILNNSKAVLQANVVGAVSAALGVLISISGALLAVLGYLDSKEKDRVERLHVADKERQDRLAALLSETLTRLVATEPRQRVVGAAGLLPFFEKDRSDFHLQALAALIAAARLDAEDTEVRQGLRVALEQAVRNVDPDALRKLSWQGVSVPRIDLRGCDLTGLDLRDVDFQDARLEGATLKDADLTAAQLQGALLKDANLEGAVLSYVDLAGASLAGAKLAGARVDGLKVLNLDLEGTDAQGVGPGWEGVPWEATRNWRRAVFDPATKAELDRRYGEEIAAIKVFMLMWEAPPFIAGGTWTACYHLVRRLRERGLAVTVILPWRRSALDADLFGVDVPVVTMEIEPPTEVGSPYAEPSRSAYGPSRQIYGSPYGGPPASLGPYGPYSAYAAGLSGSVLYGLISEFRRRLQAYSFGARPDVIHAHDWVTFEGARGLWERWGTPWVAHFHSIEADRQPGAEDPLTRAIEQMAVDAADRLVAPSALTRQRLLEAYGRDAQPAEIVPNVLSEGLADTSDMGRYETKRVVFLGRMSRQKGLDRFVQLAEAVRKISPEVQFEAFGGESGLVAAVAGVLWRGALPWRRRGEAFRAASLLVVPSVHEPFGMVVLEGMQHRVPVIYPASSGAAEVLASGVKTDPSDIAAMADQVQSLLHDLGLWERTVRTQAEDIQAYPGKDFESRLIGVWREAAAQAARRGSSQGGPSNPRR